MLPVYSLLARSATGVDLCNRSAHCEGMNGSQAHNLNTFLLLAASTRSGHERSGATGSGYEFGSAQVISVCYAMLKMRPLFVSEYQSDYLLLCQSA
jgi:hypothetical protein